MSYVPTNVQAYTAAFSGAIAGMAAAGWMTNASQASYSQVTAIAGAFAQAFDTTWANSAQLNSLEQAAITAIVSQDFQGRGPGPLTNPAFVNSSNWTVGAQACAAAVLQSDAYFAGQGITPPSTAPNPVGPNPALLVTTWYVDRVNGSDANPGTTRALPLKTKAEIARRYGTWEPTIKGINVLVTQVNADTDASDPWLMVPNLIGGANYTLTADLPAAAFTTTISAVTAKNSATNTLLQVQFNAIVGAAPAVGMMLVNSTRGNSRAFIHRIPGANQYIMTQPLSPLGVGSFGPNPAEVDTWGVGDAITGYVLTNVQVGAHGCTQPQVTDSANSGAAIWQLNAKDFSSSPGNGLLPLKGLGQCFMAECSSDVIPTGGYLNPTTYPVSVMVNMFCTYGYSLTGFTVRAGSSGSNYGSALAFGATNYDHIIGSGGCVWISVGTFGNGLALDNSATITAEGICSAFSTVIYGTGTLNVIQGEFFYPSGGGVAASTFKVTLKLNGQTTGYSNATSGGVVTSHGGITVTGANLDAAAGAAGFGGYAFGGGAAITNGAQP